MSGEPLQSNGSASASAESLEAVASFCASLASDCAALVGLLTMPDFGQDGTQSAVVLANLIGAKADAMGMACGGSPVVGTAAEWMFGKSENSELLLLQSLAIQASKGGAQ